MLTLNDGRSELWQWDTGRTLAVDADCSKVHFSNKVFGRSLDVDVVDGVAIIPDIFLQTDKDLNVWAFVGKAENGYTKISKTFKVNRRNKPADYVFTPPDQTSLQEIKEKIEYLESIQAPDAIKNAVEDYLEKNPVEAPVQSVNGQTGEVELTAEDVGAISQDDLQTGVDTALAQAKASGEFDGPQGDPGTDGGYYTPSVDGDGNLSWAASKSDMPAVTVANIKGAPGDNGITPTIGDNGNWYLGDTDTWKPSRGETGPAGKDGSDGADGKDGADGHPGADGKSSYQYAVEGGYAGTEAEFAEKLAVENIPAPATAEVGQTIVVKAVDENGKPTEWEAADMPSGSVGGQVFDEVVMLSEAVNEWSIDVPEGITDVTLLIAIPPVEANMTYGHILTNGAQSGFVTMNWGVTSEERISGVSWLVFKNGTIGQILAGNGTNWANADQLKKLVKDVTSLTSIGIKAYGAQNFPVGTTISVKGRS